MKHVLLWSATRSEVKVIMFIDVENRQRIRKNRCTDFCVYVWQSFVCQIGGDCHCLAGSVGLGFGHTAELALERLLSPLNHLFNRKSRILTSTSVDIYTHYNRYTLQGSLHLMVRWQIFAQTLTSQRRMCEAGRAPRLVAVELWTYMKTMPQSNKWLLVDHWAVLWLDKWMAYCN